jgi:conserved oligomeric Golgi complex subunit 1
MILDDVTLKDSFQMLLSMRMAALTAAVEVPKSKTTNTSQPRVHIMQQLHDAVQLIKQVITQVWSIYILKTSSLDQPSLSMPKDTELTDNFILSYVQQLQRAFSIQSIPNADQPYLQSLGIGSPASSTQPAISRIYSPNTNVHLLVRYLPESIQKYTPYINLLGEDGDGMRLETVQQDVEHWMRLATDLLTEKIAQLLTECVDIKTLLDVRQSVWEALIDDEVATNSQATFANDSHVWVSACRALFGKPLSLWHTILKAPFNQRLEALIDERTALIKNQADVLSDYLSENLKEYANGKLC